ncbi:MAG TPA: AAA family ATPase [Candidatus Polarisedimenticolia bacterium]|nr:AAA family ATPase [Candidatus Polarisedimenticolia bacterium]
MTDKTVLNIPTPSLVVLVGADGAGAASFCRRHFPSAAVVSLGECREALPPLKAPRREAAASRLAYERVEARLRRRRLAVLDAPGLASGTRRAVRAIADRHHLPAIAVTFDAAPAVRRALAREGYSEVHHLRARDRHPSSVALVPLPCDRRAERGPFDVIGDVHGCASELLTLLRRLGYRRQRGRWGHPAGRRALFLGDLVDRGPRVIEAAMIAVDMTSDGAALAVPGNHDVELAALLRGAPVVPGPGTVLSLAQIAAAPADLRRRFRRRFTEYVDRLPSHLLLDGGRLAVAHAGLLAEHVGRDSEAVRRFAVHGATVPKVDRYGLPVRVHWARTYRGRAFLIYGHTAVREPESVGATLNIDTGCCYGGALTAFRWPEQEVVQVRARRIHYRSPRTRGLRLGIRAETRAIPSSARGGRPIRPLTSS